MAEEPNIIPSADEPDAQATQALNAAEEAAQEAYEIAGAPTEFIDIPQEDATVELPPQPTERIADATEEISVPTGGTTPMPHPFEEPQSTSPIPEPVVTTAGFDVPVTATAPEQPAIPDVPVEPEPAASPYAAAVGAAGVAGAAAAHATQAPPAYEIPQAQPVGTAPAEPWRQAQSQQTGYAQPSYADPNFRQGAYQNAVPHQPFTPDPTVNPYEQSLTQLTGGMKFGWLVVGLMLSIPGMLIAWLVNVDKHPQVKKDAITWSVIGFAISVVLGIIMTVAFTGLVAAAIAQSGYYGSYF